MDMIGCCARNNPNPEQDKQGQQPSPDQDLRPKRRAPAWCSRRICYILFHDTSLFSLAQFFFETGNIFIFLVGSRLASNRQGPARFGIRFQVRNAWKSRKTPIRKATGGTMYTSQFSPVWGGSDNTRAP